MQPARRAGPAGCILGTVKGLSEWVASETDEKTADDVFDVALGVGKRVGFLRRQSVWMSLRCAADTLGL